MKTLKTIIVLGVLSALVFSSCDIPTALGAKLDLEGPVVTITSPVPRKPVSAVFSLEGEVTDYSPVKRLIVTTSINDVPFIKQWCYENGAWAISEDSGANWRPYPDATWSGSKNDVKWTVQINLDVEGETLQDGEYTFAVQAWDTGNMSDANSYRTIVLIVDHDPPKVEIISPYLYDRFSYDRPTDTFSNTALRDIHLIGDDGAERKNPEFLGKFVTQEFPLQWQIDDNHDVWSIELFLYQYNTNIDGDSQTPLPDNYIYRYYQNLPPIPERPDPENYIKPIGSIEVPALDSPQGDYNGGRLENPIGGKTTIMVVAVCYDAAGNPNQEKNLGYFVYWPKANEPFIIYPGAMQEYDPDFYYSRTIASVEAELYMIYPGKGIRSNAFHPHGIKEVVYSVYKLDDSGDTIQLPAADIQPLVDMTNVKDENPPRPNGTYSTGFTWNVKPLARSGIYLLEAYAYDAKGYRNNEPYAAVFRVQDITFPDFPESPEPVASIPLFRYINTANNTIRVWGPVTDTTEITSVKIVWINPTSRDYSTMSQLAYFRDVNYGGWSKAPAVRGNTPGDDDIFDAANPNKVWNVPLTDKGFQDDNRRHYEYSLTIDLAAHLGIGTGADQRPLNSQVFLLRAENPDKKCTVITYAPQGDTVTPTLKINEVRITKDSGARTLTYKHSEYAVIEKFVNGDVITIEGIWDEDSTDYLNINNYFKPKFTVKVKEYPLASANINLGYTGTTLVSAPYGTEKIWTATMTVGASTMTAESLKDTLVIAAEVTDIGGNDVEAGSSWLIESDHLQLMRISSEMEDATYTNKTRDKNNVEIDQEIIFFLEFNRPVRLRGSGNPQLILNNTSGTAPIATYYRDPERPDIQSSRQYFKYTVQAGQNANPLNVTGLQNPGTWSAANYPFTWYRGIEGDSEYEEIRVTNVAAHTGEAKISGYNFYARNLPVTTNPSSSDYQFTLIAGKQIVIDTTPPTVSQFIANTKTGSYTTDPDPLKYFEVYFTLRFSEDVKIGTTGTPRLSLDVVNSTSLANNLTEDGNSNVTVNGRDVMFVYKIKPGDTTNGNDVRVTGLSAGAITDLAGNSLSGAVSGAIPGIKIDTIKPGRPTVRVRVPTSATNATPTTVINTINGTDVTGISSTTATKDLSTLYHTDLWLAVESNTTNQTNPSLSGTHELNYLEYSIDNGTNWVRATDGANIKQSKTGKYDVIARQVDHAGNPSDPTLLVSFTWDPGDLVTRISSTAANGTYKTGSIIPITVTLRKTITFTAPLPEVQLNARDASNTTLYASYTSGNGLTTLTFSYTVEAGHTITLNSGNLDVTGFRNITARDSGGVTVTSMITLPTAGNNARLAENKAIKIDTVALTVTTAPRFTQALPTSVIQDDGSYWNTLDIVFSKSIYKGDGNITITQNAGTNANTYYRLPIVLTEAQYNRFSVATGLGAIDTYYTKGTNGYNNAQNSADTTPKYVLNYGVDPNSNSTTVPALFVNNFRTAEAVTIPVASSLVTIDNNTRTLRVKLEGSNAPQVPGATYTVTYPAGLVRDALDNACLAAPNTAGYNDVKLGGVAKPVVRIQKTQDSITIGTGTAAEPRLRATQPLNATARMETRTPGATVRYLVTDSTTATTGNANNVGTSSNNWSPTGNPDDMNTPTLNRPGTPGTGSTAYTAALPLGGTTTIQNVQGYRWWVRAIAVDTSNATSTETEEIAYRTVLTYQLRNTTNAISGSMNDGQAALENGDQIWIRGGDAIGSSSVPGFPFTWEDNWTTLAGKRAGIRLMSLVSTTGNTLNNSLWRFVTWDINTNAYVDMVMGHDDASTADNVFLYGPRQWAYQRAGWTSFKERYPIYPGKHRWLDTGYNHENKGNINFSATPSARPSTTY